MARTTQESAKASTTKRKSGSVASSEKKAASSETKAQARKSPAKPEAVKSPPATRRPKPAKLVQVTSQQRHALIAEAAYIRAEQRGFQGDPTQDWLEAEKEVDAQLSEHAIAS